MSTLVTLTGPTCAGKSTLERILRDKGFEPVISTTTRMPRKGEVDGESYYFVSKEAFEANLKASCYVEHVAIDGHLYGVSDYELRRRIRSGKPMVAVCDPRGQKQLRIFCEREGVDLLSVFIDGPIDMLAWRYTKRSAATVPVSIFSRRMAAMMGVEREWVAEARCDPVLYDMIVDRFDSATQDDVVAKIVACVPQGAEAVLEGA